MAVSNSRNALFESLATGLLVSSIVKTVVAPLERVKILLQTQAANPGVIRGHFTPYADGWDCFFRVIDEQGFTSLYRGNLVGIARYIPQQVLALMLNDAILSAIPHADPQAEFWKAFALKTLSGGIIGAIVNIALAPFDLARTRLASDMHRGEAAFRGFFDLSLAIVWQNGLTGFMTGTTAAIIGAFAYRIGQLSMFRQIQDLNPYRRERGLRGALSSFLAVTLARTLLMPFTYPFDTVRRRMFAEAELPDFQKKYHGSIDCFSQILCQEGTSGLFAGFGWEWGRGILGACAVVAYDTIRSSMLSRSA